MPQVGDGEDGIVCRVMPDGEVVCDKVFETSPTVAMAVASDKDGLSENPTTALAKVLPEGEWGPNKIQLALRCLEVIGASNLPDARVPARAGEIVDSIKQLLAPLPPSILLYNYSTPPANVMGAYYLNRGDVVSMQQVFKIFENPKTP